MTKISTVRPEEREARLEGYLKVTMVRDAHFVGSSPRTDLLIRFFVVYRANLLKKYLFHLNSVRYNTASIKKEFVQCPLQKNYY